MGYKNIERSREIRQWVKMGLTMLGGALYLDNRYPDLKYNLRDSLKKQFKDFKKFLKGDNKNGY